MGLEQDRPGSLGVCERQTMTLEVYEVAPAVTVIVVFLTFVKFFLTATVQGKKRFASGGRPPEDEIYKAVGLGADAPPPTFGAEPPAGEDLGIDAQAKLEETRWNRIVANDLENLPLGVAVAIVAVIVVPKSTVATLIHCIAVVAFLLLRIGHTVCYAYALQPWRTLCYLGGQAAIFVTGINACIAAFL